MNDFTFYMPTNHPIYWLQANHKWDDILPAPGAYFKLACCTAILSRAEILTRWPDRDHVFVTVQFSPGDIRRRREVA